MAPRGPFSLTLKPRCPHGQAAHRTPHPLPGELAPPQGGEERPVSATHQCWQQGTVPGPHRSALPSEATGGWGRGPCSARQQEEKDGDGEAFSPGRGQHRGEGRHVSSGPGSPALFQPALAWPPSPRRGQAGPSRGGLGNLPHPAFLLWAPCHQHLMQVETTSPQTPVFPASSPAAAPLCSSSQQCSEGAVWAPLTPGTPCPLLHRQPRGRRQLLVVPT